jgi:hypothetical protein
MVALLPLMARLGEGCRARKAEYLEESLGHSAAWDDDC